MRSDSTAECDGKLRLGANFRPTTRGRERPHHRACAVCLHGVRDQVRRGAERRDELARLPGHGSEIVDVGRRRKPRAREQFVEGASPDRRAAGVVTGKHRLLLADSPLAVKQNIPFDVPATMPFFERDDSPGENHLHAGSRL